MNGESPGPAPAFQARASNSRLTRSSWRMWPHRKLRRKVPRACPRESGGGGRLDYAASGGAVLPVRNASAASMQSPPASADATSVKILSPVLARPGASPRSRRSCTSWERPRCRAKVAGMSRPALATRRWSSKAGQTHSKHRHAGNPEFHRHGASSIRRTLSKSVKSNWSAAKLPACFSLKIRMRLPCRRRRFGCGRGGCVIAYI